MDLDRLSLQLTKEAFLNLLPGTNINHVSGVMQCHSSLLPPYKCLSPVFRRTEWAQWQSWLALFHWMAVESHHLMQWLCLIGCLFIGIMLLFLMMMYYSDVNSEVASATLAYSWSDEKSSLLSLTWHVNSWALSWKLPLPTTLTFSQWYPCFSCQRASCDERRDYFGIGPSVSQLLHLC